MSEKIKKMDDYSKLEKDYAASLSTSVDGVGNVVVKGLLKSIAFDSQKHSGLYASISNVLKAEAQVLAEKDYVALEAVIKKHIETERKMLHDSKEMLKVEKDSRVKSILTEIYLDEIKHNAFMKNLLELVVKRETLFEKDEWDMLWKDVPGHGAPPPM
jgi:rubrerythrin